MKNMLSLSLLALYLFAIGCQEPSSDQTGGQGNKPAAASAPQLETGRFALQKMIGPARLWSVDAKPVRLESEVVKGADGHDGKAAIWHVIFASGARRRAEPFMWSGLSGPDSQPGVQHGVEDSFSPQNRSTQPFDLNYLKVDSDQAFEVAQTHGGKQLLKKNPQEQVVCLLDWDPQTSQLRWHISYGGASAEDRLTVVVNASTAQFIHKE